MMPEIPRTDERRHSLRHEIKLAVDLVLTDGVILPVESLNISATGIQVLCDKWVTDEIEPRGIQSHSIRQIKLKAVTELPGKSGKNKLYAYCKIISAQRRSQNEYTLSLVYTCFENNSETALNNFLAQYEQKKRRLKPSPGSIYR